MTAVVGDARARPSGEDYDKQLAALDKALKHPAAAQGLDTARDGALKWCSAVKSRDETWPEQIGESLDTYRHPKTQQGSLIGAAKQVCSVPNEAVYRRAGVEVLQLWINETGLSETDAVASLAARVDGDTWSADHEAMCQKLISNDGHDNEAHALADARWRMFDCDDSDGDEAAWMRANASRQTQLSKFLDGGSVDRDRDEIVRYAYVTEELTAMLEQDAGDAALAPYAVVQLDIAALDPARALAETDDGPYRGSRVAKMVVRETVANMKLRLARVEAAIAKQSAAWRSAVVDAPRKAADAWRAAVAKRADVIARVEKAGTGAGCADAIRAELAPILKAMPHGSKRELEAAVSDDPIAGQLARRYATCLDAQADRAVAAEWRSFAQRVNAYFGPRGPAFLAVMTAAHADRRDKPLVDTDRLYLNDPSASGWNGEDSNDSDFYKGVIASVAKNGDGTSKVTFKTEHYQYMSQKCVETNKVDRVEKDGKVVYRQDCHDAGMVTAERTPGPLEHVPAACTAGLAVGRVVYPDGEMPGQVFVDKAAKKLATFHCFSFE